MGRLLVLLMFIGSLLSGCATGLATKDREWQEKLNSQFGEMNVPPPPNYESVK